MEIHDILKEDVACSPMPGQLPESMQSMGMLHSYKGGLLMQAVGQACCNSGRCLPVLQSLGIIQFNQNLHKAYWLIAE